MLIPESGKQFGSILVQQNTYYGTEIKFYQISQKKKTHLTKKNMKI